MNKKYFLYLIPFLLIFIYLNRSYDYFYSYLGSHPQNAPKHNITTLVTNASPSGSITYVALGDSLTAGVGVKDYQDSYPYMLAKKFNDNKVDLVDLAWPGATTTDLINNQLNKVENYHPQVITILIGVNDIHDLYSDSTFQKNVKYILTQLKKTNAKIYVISLPYLGSPSITIFPYNYLLDYRTRQFNSILLKLSTKENVRYIDLYSPTYKEFRYMTNLYSYDQFHPSAQGYSLWIKYLNVN